MSKRENLVLAFNQAKAKRQAIIETNKAIDQKIANLQEQKRKNLVKKEKLEFFLTRTQQTLEGK